MDSLVAVYNRIDAVVAPAVFGGLESMGFKLVQSKATKGMPFVDSPTGLLICLACYFLIVGFGLLRIKPAKKADKRPDPFWLRSIVIFHNVFLVLLSLYMCLEVIRQAVLNKYAIWGNAYVPKQTDMAHVIWIFYVSKLYEFFDTFIMLLKGNLNQVSFLHVYHHGSISFIWWMITYCAPGGDAYFSAAMNSWVHVCMYTYYCMSIAIGKDENKRRKYLWWGRYLTMMQMTQFALNLFQAAYCQSYSKYPKFLSTILLYYMITLLILFGNFFVRKHIISGSKKKSA